MNEHMLPLEYRSLAKREHGWLSLSLNSRMDRKNIKVPVEILCISNALVDKSYRTHQLSAKHLFILH